MPLFHLLLEFNTTSIQHHSHWILNSTFNTTFINILKILFTLWDYQILLCSRALPITGRVLSPFGYNPTTITTVAAVRWSARGFKQNNTELWNTDICPQCHVICSTAPRLQQPLRSDERWLPCAITAGDWTAIKVCNLSTVQKQLKKKMITFGGGRLCWE